MPRASATSDRPSRRARMTDGGVVFLESGIEPEVVRDLLDLGHR